ncbi:MAG: FAD-binding oxidoreductase, partial [Candidatus Bathyarchaeia archaeon]
MSKDYDLESRLKNLEKEVSELAIPAEPVETYEGYDQEKHELIKKGLISILGEKFVSDDPWVTQAYSRDYSTIFNQMRPEFVALPGSVEDVQAVVMLANRLKFALIPVGTSLSASCKARGPNTVILDLAKRMNKIILLDAKNMYAVVEPGVTYAQLHAEAIKKGLTHHGAPSSGSQSKLIANVIGMGAVNAKGYRYGVGPDNILGLEIVLPSGDILWTGSAAMPEAGYFWGEGPGPDLRGIITGKGSYGSMGIVTKMAYKLHPWPGPSSWPAEGYLPHIKTRLPENLHRAHLFRFPDYRKLVDALYEIGKCEVGYAIHSITPHQIAGWYCRSNKQFFKLYFEEKYFHTWAPTLFIHLVALTSQKQLEYVKEYGGEEIPKSEIAKDFLETAGIEWGYADVHGCRTMRYTGTYAPIMGTMGPLDLIYEVGRKDSWQLQIRDKYHPPLVDVVPYDAIIWPMEFCHWANQEQSVFPEKAP